MTFRDLFLTCQNCGKQFVYTVDKQRKAAESGQPAAAPTHCPVCTQGALYHGKLHGRIVKFFPDRGFGFVLDDQGRETFFHRDGVLAGEDGVAPPTEEGQEVLFEVMETRRGLQAYNLEAIETP